MMTEKNKPMSEVEIWERAHKDYTSTMELVYEVIQLARLNTIPTESVSVPSVEEITDYVVDVAEGRATPKESAQDIHDLMLKGGA
jgi:hypothetical protein